MMKTSKKMTFLKEPIVFRYEEYKGTPKVQKLYLKSIKDSPNGKTSPFHLSHWADDENIPHADISEKEIKITVRLANSPQSLNLLELFEKQKKEIPPDVQVIYKKYDLYLIMHGIGVTNEGLSGTIQQLIYHADIEDLPDSRTIDEIPNTDFKTYFHAKAKASWSLSANGSVSAEVPSSLTNSLSTTSPIKLGGGIVLKASTDPELVGQIDWDWKFPITQATGKNASYCEWILEADPSKDPLLGDQVLMQTIAVPKNTSEVKFNIHGKIRVKPHWYSSKPLEKETPIHLITVKL